MQLKAKVTGPDDATKEVKVSVEELEKLSVTPGYIVRMPTADGSGPLEFVGLDEDGWRRVGPRSRIVTAKTTQA